MNGLANMLGLLVGFIGLIAINFFAFFLGPIMWIVMIVIDVFVINRIIDAFVAGMRDRP